MFKKRLSALFFGILLCSSVNLLSMECMVCWEDQEEVVERNSVLLQIGQCNNNHVACRECHQEHIGANRGQVRMLRCQGNDCNAQYVMNDFENIFDADGLADIHAQLANEERLANQAARAVSQERWEWMNGPEMSHGAVRNDNTAVCRARMCPGCPRIIERNGGCNHVQCPCGIHFCYRCLRDWHQFGVNAPGHNGYFNCRANILENLYPNVFEGNNNIANDQVHQVFGAWAANVEAGDFQNLDNMTEAERAVFFANLDDNPVPAPVVIPGPNPNPYPGLANVPGRRINRLGRNNNNPPRMVVSNGNHTVRNSIIVSAVIATTTLVFVKWQWIKQKATKFKNWVGSKFSRNKKIVNKDNMQQNNAVKVSA